MVLETNKDNLVSNNLGGMGPVKTDPEEIRFANAGPGIDLRITVREAGAYKAVDQSKPKVDEDGVALNINGARGDFGNINIAHRGPSARDKKFTHKFRFEYVEHQTNTPVEIKSVMFTFFDVDHPKDSGEQISSCDADNAVRSAPTDLNIKTVDGCKVFGSSQKAVDNVRDFRLMTPHQKKSSVVMEFSKKTGFDLDYTIAKSTRNFLFIADPTFVCEDYPPNRP